MKERARARRRARTDPALPWEPEVQRPHEGDAGTQLLPQVLRSEVNLLVFPFFVLSRQEVRRRLKLEYRTRLEAEGRRWEILWRVTANPEFGFPGPFDRRVHRALEQLLTERGLPVENPVPFSFYDLCTRLDLPDSGRNLRLLKEALRRIKATTVESRGAFYSKAAATRIEDVFSLYDRVIFRGDRLPDGRVAESNLLYLGTRYLESLNAQYVRPLDFRFYKSLQSDIAQRLYELLGVKFYYLFRRLGGADPEAAEGPGILYRYSTLCHLLPLKSQRYFSQACQVLEPAHRELRRRGYLGEVSWEEIPGERSDWRVRYRPGPQAWAEFRRFARSLPPSSPEPTTGRPEELPLWEPEPAGEAPEAAEAEAQALVAEILETTQDPHSERFYRRLAQEAVRRPRLMDLIYRCLSEVKVEAREGGIRNRGAAFTEKLQRYCRRAGIPLSLRGFGG